MDDTLCKLEERYRKLLTDIDKFDLAVHEHIVKLCQIVAWLALFNYICHISSRFSTRCVSYVFVGVIAAVYLAILSCVFVSALLRTCRMKWRLIEIQFRRLLLNQELEKLLRMVQAATEAAAAEAAAQEAAQVAAQEAAQEITQEFISAAPPSGRPLGLSFCPSWLSTGAPPSTVRQRQLATPSSGRRLGLSFCPPSCLSAGDPPSPALQPIQSPPTVASSFPHPCYPSFPPRGSSGSGLTGSPAPVAGNTPGVPPAQQVAGSYRASCAPSFPRGILFRRSAVPLPPVADPLPAVADPPPLECCKRIRIMLDGTGGGIGSTDWSFFIISMLFITSIVFVAGFPIYANSIDCNIAKNATTSN